MKIDFIGPRIKEIRTTYFEENQEEFCKKVNQYLKINSKEKISEKKIFFTQSIISEIENKSNQYKKMIILVNYFFNTERINPAWILVENNNGQPMQIKNIIINKSEKEIIDKISNLRDNILDEINDLIILSMNKNTTSKT